MRLSLFAVAAALALATCTLAADSNASSALALRADQEFEEVVDDDGTVIRVFHSGGDPLGEFDEDLDDGAGPARRSTHKQLAASKRSKKTKAMAGHYTTGPVGSPKLIDGNVKVTWYGANDLKNPQCGDGSWSPNNNDHIGAVMAGWAGGPACGEFVQICSPKSSRKGGRCVLTRIVDKCAGCTKSWIDLSQSTFKMLAPSGTLDEGVLKGMKVYSAEKPTSWDYGLFGPVRLRSG